jgi:hypothetical protein
MQLTERQKTYLVGAEIIASDVRIHLSSSVSQKKTERAVVGRSGLHGYFALTTSGIRFVHRANGTDPVRDFTWY